VSDLGLAEFVKARLGEEEAAAKAWLPLGNPDAAQREHVARVDPGRVLREVEAKRMILADYQRLLADRKLHPDDLAVAGALLALHGAVLALAAVDRDRADYDPSWSPDETMRP
jgi:hypothetical protein